MNFLKKLIILVTCLLVPAWNLALAQEAQKPVPPSVLEKEPEVPRITPKQVMDLLYKGEDIMIVDVRSFAEYNARRIIGARSIPVNEIEARIKEFPRDKDIIFY
ncbi:molybdopterin biosynthesis-like protein MoeZ [bacterium BMS3Abin10]|nr:molybdopterin biosynthesis-like protein MoeZ [bacterium BMS3Abin10]GBE38936.1 molybdopterin biosynthesis-like protein MoeZ [bacterium BMS3Bbin08]